MTASGLTIAAIMGAMLLVFIFSGYYLFAALGGAAIISGLIFWGPNVFQTIYFSVFKYCKDYNLLAVPLFVLMGQLLNQSGVAGRLFDNLSVALGRQRGGMAIAATLIAILFAATTGIVGASVVSMGLLFTMPMLDAKYNKSLTAGVIISGGTLGILIPPSIMLVFMGSAANVSVGKLFYGAMTPGVLLGVAYIVYVKVISIVKKDYAPPMPEEVLSRYSKKQIAWGIVVNVLPVAIVIFSVLGAIWFGWCPATEAAALGVAALRVPDLQRGPAQSGTDGRFLRALPCPQYSPPARGVSARRADRQCARRAGPLSFAVDGAAAFRSAARGYLRQSGIPGPDGSVPRASGYSFPRADARSGSRSESRLRPAGPARPGLKAAQKARRPARTVHQNPE